MQINLINRTNQDVYLRFGTATPIGTFNGASLSSADSYLAPASSTTTGLNLTDFSGGKMLFSLGQPLSSSLPDFQYQSGDPDWQIRWDKIELSLYSDTTKVSVANLSATDFFGIPLKLETFGPGSSTPIDTLTWNVQTATIFSSLAQIANHNPTTFNNAIVPGSNGLSIPTYGNILRVIAPSSLPPPAIGNYQSPQPYIDYVAANAIATHVTGQFSAAGGSGPTQTQTYDFQATIPTSGVNTGALVMTGSGSVVGGAKTIIVAAADLATGIISENPPYTVNGAAANIGNNDVYAAVVRDMLAAFGFGFVGSTEINPNTGHRYIDDPTGDWYLPPPGQSVAYENAQPTNNGFYSQYAAIIAKVSDAYGFPFTDLIGAPLADINPNLVDHVNITILADTDGLGAVPCFVTGTLIETDLGPITVEALAIGMRTTTILGRGLARIVWIGHRTVDCRRHPNPKSVRPVRIAQDAFAAGIPTRDLLLSPDHAVFVDDVLIPIRYLVNGTTVAQLAAEQVTYWHVELERHDILLASGLPAESFLDTGNRSAFANGGAVVAAHPDFARLTWEGQGCAPLMIVGPIVEGVRSRLADRARVLAVEANYSIHTSRCSEALEKTLPLPLRERAEGRSFT